MQLIARLIDRVLDRLLELYARLDAFGLIDG